MVKTLPLFEIHMEEDAGKLIMTGIQFTGRLEQVWHAASRDCHEAGPAIR